MFLRKKKRLFGEAVISHIFTEHATYYRAFISLIYTLTCQKLNKCESREEDSSSEYHVYGCSL